MKTHRMPNIINYGAAGDVYTRRHWYSPSVYITGAANLIREVIPHLSTCRGLQLQNLLTAFAGYIPANRRSIYESSVLQYVHPVYPCTGDCEQPAESYRRYTQSSGAFQTIFFPTINMLTVRAGEMEVTVKKDRVLQSHVTAVAIDDKYLGMVTTTDIACAVCQFAREDCNILGIDRAKELLIKRLTDAVNVFPEYKCKSVVKDTLGIIVPSVHISAPTSHFLRQILPYLKEK